MNPIYCTKFKLRLRRTPAEDTDTDQPVVPPTKTLELYQSGEPRAYFDYQDVKQLKQPGMLMCALFLMLRPGIVLRLHSS
jgi:hypothetical protein